MFLIDIDKKNMYIYRVYELRQQIEAGTKHSQIYNCLHYTSYQCCHTNYLAPYLYNLTRTCLVSLKRKPRSWHCQRREDKYNER